MSEITVTIKTDGAAFRVPETGDEDGHGADLETAEVRRVLSAVADRIDRGEHSGYVFDINGNAAVTYVRTED